MRCVVTLATALVQIAASATPPGLSWATLPVHWFSSNATAQLSAEAAARIAGRHSLAIISGQAHAYYAAPAGTGAETKMIEAGRRLKLASADLGKPPIAVLAYFNSVLDWTAYNFHTWMAADPSRYLTDAHGKPVVGRRDALNNTLRVPDFGQPAVAARWLANVVNTSQQMDGLFIDQGKWCSPFACKSAPGVFAPGRLDNWTHGHWQTLQRLRAALPDQLIILNNLNTTDFPRGFDHEYEHFNATLPQFVGLQTDATDGRLAVCHVEGAPFTTALPLFLLGAGHLAYFAAPFQRGDGLAPGDNGWIEPAWDGWRPEYSRELGAALGPAAVVDGMATRRFASGTVVEMNLTHYTASRRLGGCVYWADGNVTGPTFPGACKGPHAPAGGGAAVIEGARASPL